MFNSVLLFFIYSANSFDWSDVVPPLLSTALPIFKDLGKPEFPVINTCPFLRAIKAPVETVGQKIIPEYSIFSTLALRIICVPCLIEITSGFPVGCPVGRD